MWLCVSTCTNVFRYSCSLPYIPYLIGKVGVVSAAIVPVIVTRVSSRMRERRGILVLYIHRTMLMEGMVSAVIVLINR